MSLEFVPDWRGQQTSEYNALQAEMIKLMTVRAEHDRSDQESQFTGLRG